MQLPPFSGSDDDGEEDATTIFLSWLLPESPGALQRNPSQTRGIPRANNALKYAPNARVNTVGPICAKRACQYHEICAKRACHVNINHHLIKTLLGVVYHWPKIRHYSLLVTKTCQYFWAPSFHSGHNLGTTFCLKSTDALRAAWKYSSLGPLMCFRASRNT